MTYIVRGFVHHYHGVTWQGAGRRGVGEVAKCPDLNILINGQQEVV